ncbi:MAG TPA: TetR/AcrR family transcriptional regulator [Solirubrobacterales bacterium]|nr:TetR/AcrR family transcriptional regulator [Solirubrobacterales bacterium]
MTPITRREKQVQTRARLLQSATRLFCRRGLEQASVDEIAQSAGYTKGAFYSNFKTKEELFLAILDERFSDKIEQIESALRTDESPDEAVRHAGEDVMRLVGADPEWQKLFLEFVSYAARNEDFREELLTRCRAMDAQLTEVYRRWSQDVGIEPPIPMEDATRMVTMMSHGFMLGKQLDPELDEALYGTMLAAFMVGLRAMSDAKLAQAS